MAQQVLHVGLDGKMRRTVFPVRASNVRFWRPGTGGRLRVEVRSLAPVRLQPDQNNGLGGAVNHRSEMLTQGMFA